MLGILLRARLSALSHSLFSGNKKKRTIPMIVLFAILILYAAVGSLVFLGIIFASLLPALLEVGALHVYLAIGGAAAFLIMLLGNVYFTKNQLYTADDNEFLLAMPIPPRTILLSWLILVLLTSFLFEAIVALPMLVVYLFFAKVRLAVLASMLLVFLVLPFLAQSISALLAYLISRIAARIRRKSLLTTLLSILFLAVYYAFTFGLGDFLDDPFGDITPIVRFVDGFLPLAALGNAIAGRLIPLLALVLLAAGVTAATLLWLSRSFIGTALENRGAPNVKYRDRAVQQKSPLYALTVRELRHLGSSTGWMMNAGLGLLFALVPPVYLLFDGGIIDAVVAEMPSLVRLLPAVAGVVVTGCLSMVFLSAVTVSLEGRTLWLVRSLPIPTKTVLYSKILLQLIPASAVALIAGILFAIALRLAPIEALMLLVFLFAYALTSATLGLTVNLLFPKMEWKNELVPIKQSAASFLAMVGNVICVSIGGGVAVLLSLWIPAAAALLCGALVLAGIAYALLSYVNRGGVRQFESL